MLTVPPIISKQMLYHNEVIPVKVQLLTGTINTSLHYLLAGNSS